MNLFDLVAKITLDTGEYERGLNDASGKLSSFGTSLKNGLTTAAKVGASAIGVAATAVGALVKNSVSNFSEYEQLVGGVQTLFKDSADVVQEYASNAFRTAGMSANEYMKTVTSFSAALLQSLDGDTQAAADYANTAITDMSDNANKMGTSIEAIQNAYQGFAKQNYTMLDNLKLGYGGTKTEMERLITDAEALNDSFKATRDENGNLAMSYADIVDAIHIVQTEMGIVNTTADEASTTIQGSLSAVKAAWSNLTTGIADENANLSGLINNLVDSVTTAGSNIVPRIEQALVGVGQLIEGLSPVITNAIPGIIENVLPSLLEASASLISSIGSALVDNLPMLVSVGLELIHTLATGIGESLPELIPAIVDVILTIAEYLIDNVDLMIDASIALIMGLADGLIEAVPKLIEKAPEIVMKLIEALITNAPKIVMAAIELIFKLIEGIVGMFGKIIEVGADIIKNIKEGIAQKIEDAKKWGKDLMDKFVSGIKEKWERLKQTVSNVAGSIKKILGFSEPEEGPLSDFHTYAPDMMQLFAKGIRENEHLITDQLNKSFDFGDQIVSANAPKLVGAGSGTSITGLTININGANYSDEQALAEAIADRLQRMTERRSAVYA